jgi:hypothetical protein
MSINKVDDRVLVSQQLPIKKPYRISSLCFTILTINNNFLFFIIDLYKTALINALSFSELHFIKTQKK